jgi:hypothetical protein
MPLRHPTIDARAMLVLREPAAEDAIDAAVALAAARGATVRVEVDPQSGDRIVHLAGDAADEIARAVAQLVSTWTLDELAARLTHGRSPDELIRTIRRVGHTSVARDAREHMQLLQRVLYHPAREVRLAAVRATAHLATAPLLALLADAAPDEPDGDVRAAIAARLEAMKQDVRWPAPDEHTGDDDLPF